MQLDESPFHDDSPSTATAIANQEWSTLSTRYIDQGYNHGITQGKHHTLQSGFDQGFALATPPARALGSLRGKSNALLSLLTTQAGAKLLPPPLLLLTTQEKETIVIQVRDLVTRLAKLIPQDLLPPDREALAHAKTHDPPSDSLKEEEEEEFNYATEKEEMNLLERGLEGVSVHPVKQDKGGKESGVQILQRFEMEWEGIIARCGFGGAGAGF